MATIGSFSTGLAPTINAEVSCIPVNWFIFSIKSIFTFEKKVSEIFAWVIMIN